MVCISSFRAHNIFWRCRSVGAMSCQCRRTRFFCGAHIVISLAIILHLVGARLSAPENKVGAPDVFAESYRIGRCCVAVVAGAGEESCWCRIWVVFLRFRAHNALPGTFFRRCHSHRSCETLAARSGTEGKATGPLSTTRLLIARRLLDNFHQVTQEDLNDGSISYTVSATGLAVNDEAVDESYTWTDDLEQEATVSLGGGRCLDSKKEAVCAANLS